MPTFNVKFWVDDPDHVGEQIYLSAEVEASDAQLAGRKVWRANGQKPDPFGCAISEVTKPTGLEPRDYKRALDVQDACNLSGVVRSFAAMTESIWAEARKLGEGTEWVNKHPISVLFACKIASLTGGPLWPTDGVFKLAHDACSKAAEGA